MAAGRPTDYKPEFCQMVIDHMASGLSFESFAGIVECHKSSLYEWQAKHPEFSDAVSLAFSKCKVFWESKGIDGLETIHSRDKEGGSFSKSMNATIWKFNMQNRFGWADKVETKNENKEVKDFKVGWGDEQNNQADASKQDATSDKNSESK